MDRRQFLKSVYKTAGIAGLCGIGLSLKEAKCFADTNPYVIGVPIAQGSGTDCPTGTYAAAWNGEYPADSDKACLNSGASQVDGTITGAEIGPTYGETGNGIKLDAGSDKVVWVIDETVNTGTVWLSVKSVVAPAANGFLFELTDGTTRVSIRLDTNLTLRGIYGTQGNSSSNTLTADTYARVGYSWDKSGTDKHSINVGSTWKEEIEALGTVASNFNSMAAGTTNSSTIARDTYLDNIRLINGAYQASDPL